VKRSLELTAKDTNTAILIDVNMYERRDGTDLTDDVYSSAGTLLFAGGECVRANVIALLQPTRYVLGAKHTARARLQSE
jgi:hypothetical protein